MKQKLFSFFLVCLLCVTGCKNQILTNPSVSTPPSSADVSSSDLSSVETSSAKVPFTAEFTVTERKLIPPEQNFGAEFSKALEKLTDAVHSKNLTVLDDFLDNETMVDFGGSGGKAKFYEHWELNKNPENSKLWTELKKIFDLGGTYDENEKRFVAPYVFSDFPEELDAFTHFVITGTDIKVYTEKNLESKVAGVLNDNIIKASEDNGFFEKTDQDFIGIKISSGSQGYIQKKYIRSPIGYRLSLVYKKSGWKLTYMVEGD